MDSKNLSFIKLYRCLSLSTIWDTDEPFDDRSAWVDLLMTARWKEEPSKVKIGKKILTCNKGECLKSKRTWAKHWNWSYSRVTRYFDMLEELEMIRITDESVTTRISICNYSTYQSLNLKPESQMNQKRITNGSLAITDVNHLRVTEEEGEEGKKVKKEKNKSFFKKNPTRTNATTTTTPESNTKYAVAEAVKKKRCINLLYHSFISTSVNDDIKIKRVSISKSEVYSWLDKLLMSIEPACIKKSFESCRWPYTLEKLGDYILNNTSTDDEILDKLIG